MIHQTCNINAERIFQLTAAYGAGTVIFKYRTASDRDIHQKRNFHLKSAGSQRFFIETQ